MSYYNNYGYNSRNSRPSDNNDAVSDPLVTCLMEDNPKTFQSLLAKDSRYVIDSSHATFNLFHSREQEQNNTIKIKPTGQTIMHLIAFHDSIQVLLYYIKMHKKQLEAKNYEIFELKNGEEYNPLHMAIYGGSLAVASLILKYRPDLAKIEIPHHHQYLSLAAFSGSPLLIDLLFAHGVDPNSRLNTLVDKEFPLPMTIAIEHKDINCIRALIKGNLHSKNQTNASPVIYAINQNYYDAVPLLLESGESPDAVNPQKVIGQQNVYECPLSAACFCGEPAINAIRAIVSKIPGDLMPNTKNDLTGGPAHWISQSTSLRIATILAQRKFDPNFADSRKRSPIYNLLDRNIPLDTILGILNIFLKQGLDINRESDAAMPVPPIMEVLKASSEKYQEDILKWFAQNGVDPGIKVDPAGHTLREIVKRKKRYYKIFKDFWPAEE